MSTTISVTYPPQLVPGVWQSVTLAYNGSTPAASNTVTASVGTFSSDQPAASTQWLTFTFRAPATGSAVTFADEASGATASVAMSGSVTAARRLGVQVNYAQTVGGVTIPADPDDFIARFNAGGPNGATVARLDTNGMIGPPAGVPMIRSGPGNFYYYVPDVAPAATFSFFYQFSLNANIQYCEFFALPTPATPTPTPTSTVTIDAAAAFRPGCVATGGSDATTEVIAGSSFVLLARVLDGNGNPITASTVTSIVTVVTNIPDATSVTVSSPTDLTTVIFNPLRVDARWTEDSVGYNLALGIPGTAVPTPARTYQAIATVTMTSGDVFKLLWDLQTIG